MNDLCASEHRTKYGGIKRCVRTDGHGLPHRDCDGGEWVAFRDVALEYKSAIEPLSEEWCAEVLKDDDDEG